MPRSPRCVPIAAALATVAFLAPIGARAAGNEAAAEALFVEAQKLVKQKNYAEACPKFAESNKLDRGAGTLIHLANCYEKNKQTASAWATYKEAASAAQALGRADWQKLATQRASALEPKLAKLTIKVSEPVDKLEVTKDGAPLTSASWGMALPVDVGAHVIEASAPGHEPFSTTANISKDGEKMEIAVPKLTTRASEPAAEGKPELEPKPVQATAPDEADGSGQRTVGYAIGGVGVAALAVGGITGLMAMSKNNTSQELCPNDGACGSQEGVDSNESAKSLGLVSTIAFGAGAAMVIGGALLVLTAPRSSGKEARGVRVAPTANARGGGLFLSGAF